MEKAMAPHSSTLARKIPLMEEPGRLKSMGSPRNRHNWATSLSLFTFMHRRWKWQPTPVILPGESLGTGEPGGLPSMTSHRVGHDRSDLAAAAAWSWLLNICAYEVLITQSCPTVCYPKDCSPPGSSVQARIPEAAISFSRGASQPRDWTPVSCDSCIAGGFFITEPSRKPIYTQYYMAYCSISKYNWTLSWY